MAMQFHGEITQPAIWKMFQHEKPLHCPECGCPNTLDHIRTDAHYSSSNSAELYQCTLCRSWLALIIAKIAPRTWSVILPFVGRRITARAS